MQTIPNAPTMGELGLKHTEPQIWHSIVARVRLHANLHAQINTDIQPFS